MKNKRSCVSYLNLITGSITLIACFTYTRVMYQWQVVPMILAGVVLLAVLAVVGAKALPSITSFAPVLMAPMLAGAGVCSAHTMMNQLGFVVAGLEGIHTIYTWIAFVALVVCGILISIVTSFLNPLNCTAE